MLFALNGPFNKITLDTNGNLVRTPGSNVRSTRTAQDYATVVGTPPSPAKLSFRYWFFDLLNYRLSYCPLVRTTTYYFAQAGNDSTGDGSQASPWKTLAKAQAIHDAAGSNADIRLRFNRGDVWKEGTAGTPLGLTLSKANVTADLYGSGAKPNFSAFTTAVTSGWTDETNGVYSRTVAASPKVAWVRNTADPLGEVNGPYAMAASTATMNGTVLQFWHDTANSKLYVYAGGAVVNGLSIEWVYENSVSGVLVSGDGCRVQGIRCDGYGIKPGNSTYQTQKCGHQFIGTGTAQAVFVDCESWFGASHLLQHYGGGTTGGISTWVGCVCGWLCPTGAANFSNLDALNSYTANGTHETIWHGCEARYGTLPDSANGLQASTDKRGGNVGLCHTNGGAATIGLVIHSGTRHVTPPNGYGYLGGSGFNNAPTPTTTSDYRAIAMDCRYEGLSILSGTNTTVDINPTYVVDPSATATIVRPGSGASSPLPSWINPYIGIKSTYRQVHTFVNAGGGVVNWEMAGGMIQVLGDQSASTTINGFAGTSASSAGTVSGSIIDFGGVQGATRVMGFAAGMTLDGNVYSNLSATTGTTTDTNAVRVSNRFQANALAANALAASYPRGSAITFRGEALEYDKDWKPRSSTPTVGPWEAAL